MTGAALASGAALEGGGAVLGLAFGLTHFKLLRLSVVLYGAGRYLAPSALTLGRVFGAALFFGLVAQMGSLLLLSAFLAFLVARTFALRTVRRIA
jgi:hypothetical protein